MRQVALDKQCHPSLAWYNSSSTTTTTTTITNDNVNTNDNGFDYNYMNNDFRQVVPPNVPRGI